MTKKRSWEILRDEWKIFSRASKILVGTGHPTASARHWVPISSFPPFRSRDKPVPDV